MEKIKIGIIGTGNISNYHLGGYKALPELCEVIACCDIDETKVKRYAANNGIARYYTDYNEMMAKEKLDAVSVCTWNAAHKGAVIAALKGGVNVICEKPMAMNEEEAIEMQKVSEETGKLLMIGFVRRFGNDADILKNFIDKGTLGELYYAKATYLRRNGCPGGWFGDKKYSGGGPLIDVGVHVIDLVRYLSGGPKPVSVFGVTYNNLGENRATGGQSWVSSTMGIDFKYTVEDFSSAMIRFDNGMTLVVEASFNLNVKNDMSSIELFGTKSGAKIDPQIEFFSDMNGMLVDIKPHGDTALNFNGLFNREIAHFVDCVCKGIPCRSSAKEGVVLMRIIDAIYKSAETGCEVKLDCQ
ncbi:MAG: oxidoreductase [Clostridiales bacterium GWF2_36_10]|nr:MAG: oxidoreductase [Clostridiales bacterium GWF2_36_10]